MINGYISCKGMKCPNVNMYGQYEFWKDPMYKKYIITYGEHFSPELAKQAGMAMENRDGSDHFWTREEVKKAFDDMAPMLPNGYKLCDAHYIANMMYADYFGSGAKTESDVLKLAWDYMADPDGYDTKAFYHFLTDIMVKGHVIDWSEVM